MGVLPGAAWAVFALLYYGSVLPSSAHAKLGSGIPLREIVNQGLGHLSNSLAWDPVTLFAMAALVGLGVADARVDREGAMPAAEGYPEAAIGEGRIADPAIAEYWSKLVLVTRGPVFDGARLALVARFALGLVPGAPTSEGAGLRTRRSAP
jgi:hypothetical protein